MSVWDEVIKGISTSGPVALVLMAMLYLVWQQNKDLLKELRSDKVKMLKLAMRTVRAIEALAGLEPPEDDDLDEEDDP